MLAEERRSRLLELVQQRGFASLPALQEAMQVSASTIRRDLDYLEQTGTAKRTHGGVFYTGPSPKLGHFDQRQRSQWEKKRQIAAAAAELLEDGDTVLLDGGSTTYELARRLVGRNVQIVTNSLPVATLFTSGANHDVILIGGYVHLRTGVCLGPYSVQMLSELSVRRAVLSVGGISRRGCFNSNLLLVETEQAMMRAADEVIVVADSTKFGHQSLARICGLEEVDRMVVDDSLEAKWQDELRGVGVDLILAGPVTDSSPEGSAGNGNGHSNGHNPSLGTQGAEGDAGDG